jgi:hypothetical protein
MTNRIVNTNMLHKSYDKIFFIHIIYKFIIKKIRNFTLRDEQFSVNDLFIFKERDKK